MELGKMDRALIRMRQKSMGLNGNLAKIWGLNNLAQGLILRHRVNNKINQVQK